MQHGNTLLSSVISGVTEIVCVTTTSFEGYVQKYLTYQPVIGPIEISLQRTIGLPRSVSAVLISAHTILSTAPVVRLLRQHVVCCGFPEQAS